jgi:hypothetical protein
LGSAAAILKWQFPNTVNISCKYLFTTYLVQIKIFIARLSFSHFYRMLNVFALPVPGLSVTPLVLHLGHADQPGLPHLPRDRAQHSRGALQRGWRTLRGRWWRTCVAQEMSEIAFVDRRYVCHGVTDVDYDAWERTYDVELRHGLKAATLKETGWFG